MTRTIDDEDIGRMIDIIGDGDLTAEVQERLHEEGHGRRTRDRHGRDPLQSWAHDSTG
jgi:hypothetical protein